MYNRLREIAYSSGANNCPSCGKLDIAFGTFKKDGEKFPTCVYCSKTVEQYDFENTLLYVLKVFRLLTIEKNEVKVTASFILKNKIDDILSPFASDNIIPSADKIKDLQKFIKDPVELNFGGPLIGGFVKIQSGKPSVSIIETNNNPVNVYALFVSVAVVKYLLILTNIQPKTPNLKTEATPQMLALMIGIMVSDLYLKPENKKPANVFEVLLFSSIEILDAMKKRLPGYYPEFETEYFNEIENFAIKHGIKKYINGDFNEFVDSRFQLYGIELNILLQHSDVLPTKIAHHFFDAPLSPVSSDSMDILKVSELKFKIEESANSNLIGKSIDKIITDLKLIDKISQPKKPNKPNPNSENPLGELVESQFKYLAIDGKSLDFRQYFQAFYKMILKERADHKYAVSQVMEIPSLILLAIQNSTEVAIYLKPYRNEILYAERLFKNFDNTSKYLIDDDVLPNAQVQYKKDKQMTNANSPYNSLVELASTDSEFQQELKWFINNENHYDLFRQAAIKPSAMYLQNCKWILELFNTFYMTSIGNKSEEIKNKIYNDFFILIAEKLEDSKKALFLDRDLPQNQNYEAYEVFKKNAFRFEFELMNLVSMIENSQLPKSAIQKLKSTSIVDGEKSKPTPKATGGGCYIATMVYGNYNHPQVIVLRNYRDESLLNNVFGRLFVQIYYFVSPIFVSLLKDNKKINLLIKRILDKRINLLRQKKK